jgi:hypothetical protein
MESLKLGSQNPLMNKNKMTQKLVQYGDYNKLWDDVAAVDADLQDQINNIGGGGPLIADMGALSPIAIQLNGGASAVITLVSAGVYDSVINLSQILLGVSTAAAVPVMTYGMVKQGGQAPVLSANITDWSLNFDETELGTQGVDVYVNDGTDSYKSLAFVIILDNNAVVI